MILLIVQSLALIGFNIGFVWRDVVYGHFHIESVQMGVASSPSVRLVTPAEVKLKVVS
jgi:hypothetical protein